MSTQSLDNPSKWLEVVAAIILSLATLATAWSSYQAAQWSRTQAITANAVVAKLLESAQLSTLGGQDILVDVVIFTNWLEAVSVENQPLSDFYSSRFREEFKPAFEAWLASHPLENPEAPSSPFAMQEYTPARLLAASELQNEAGELQKQARNAADNAEYYVRNTLYLASSLFFVGISRMFAGSKVRLTLQVIATGLLLLGVFNLILGPIA